jgi:hypothetical protein
MRGTPATFGSRRCSGTVLFVVWMVIPLQGCGACEPDRTPAAKGDSSPDAPSPTITMTRSSAVDTVHQSQPLCRVLAIDGDVRVDTSAGQSEADGGPVLAIRSEIPPLGWLSLGANARLVAKDPRTARETIFRGPGRARVCVDLGEESWVAAGTFESALGTGEAPGAEEWVVTPLGVVRFGGGKVRLEVLGKRVRVSVASGAAFLWMAGDASTRIGDGGAPRTIDDGWARIPDGDATLTASTSRTPLDVARDALEKCTQLARSARDLTSKLLAGDAESATAAQQVVARRLARAACAVASLRADILPAPDASSEVKSRLSSSLGEAAALWRSLPAETSTNR